MEEEDDNEGGEEEEKSEAAPDSSADVTLAADHLQLTSTNEKSAKSHHGFKVGRHDRIFVTDGFCFLFWFLAKMVTCCKLFQIVSDLY